MLRCREVSRDRGRSRDTRAHEVRTPALALATLEVAIARRGAPLAGRQGVGVHAQTHRATGAAPLEPGGGEDLVEALLLGLDLDRDRAGNDKSAQAFAHGAAPDHVGGYTQVLDPRVRAGADE